MCIYLRQELTYTAIAWPELFSGTQSLMTLVACVGVPSPLDEPYSNLPLLYLSHTLPTEIF